MSTLSFAYYPGCSGEGTSSEYDKSTRAVCAALGIELKDVPDWSCCGSTPAHTVDHALAAALAARNFAQAEDAGLDHLLTPCPSCLKNLRNALEETKDPAMKARVDELTLRPLKRDHSVRSVLQAIVEQVGLEKVAGLVKKPLTGLKLVPYYGCLMTRPADLMRFDDPENPVSMDRLLEAAGAEVIPFPLKVECCGASMGIPRGDVVPRLSGKIVGLAVDLGAHAIVAACPLCQMNLDMRQGQINSARHANYRIPVIYYTQLLGLALGLDRSSLGFDKLTVDPEPALAQIGKVAPKPEPKAKAKPAAKPESPAGDPAVKGKPDPKAKPEAAEGGEQV